MTNQALNTPQDVTKIEPPENEQPNVLTKKRNVLYRDQNSIFILNRTNDLNWRIKKVPDYAIPAQQRFHKLNSLISANLTRGSKRHAYQLLASAFYTCLKSKGPCNIDDIYSDVQKYVSRRQGEIKTRIVECPDFAVYINQNNSVNWWVAGSRTDIHNTALNEFEYIKQLITTTIPKGERIIANRKLASALSVAFSKSSEDAARSSFDDVRAYIAAKFTSYINIMLFITNVISCLLFVSLMILLYNFFPQFKEHYIAAAAGVFGAMVSCLQRKNEINVDNYTGVYGLRCESLSRLIIGAVFGVFVIFAAKSGIVLSTFTNNLNALVCFGFISGFVERFVPDLINGVSGKEGVN